MPVEKIYICDTCGRNVEDVKSKTGWSMGLKDEITCGECRDKLPKKSNVTMGRD